MSFWLPLLIFVFSVIDVQANLASLVFGGAEAIGRITARFPETVRLSHPTDADIAESAAHIAEGLGIDSPGQLKFALERLEITDPQDVSMRASVLALFDTRFSDGISPPPGAFYNAMSDLSRLVHRYGGAERDDVGVLFPLPRSVDNGRRRRRRVEFVALHRLTNPGLVDIVRTLPLRNPGSLRDILEEDLLSFGFLEPLPRDIAGLSPERTVAWILLFKSARSGSRSMMKLAETILEAMVSGHSKSFFHPSNRNELYGLLFVEAQERLSWTVFLQRVVLARRRSGLTLRQAIDSVAETMPRDVEILGIP